MALTRREFLAGGLSLTLGLSAQHGALAADLKAINKSSGLSGAKKPVLVVVNLSGGNDAFNTVVPWTNQAYCQARPNLALGEGQVVALNNELALAAPLLPLLKYFTAGQMAVLPGVGLASGLSRSHSRAAEIWHSAEPDAIGKSGWIGRYLDTVASVGTAGAYDFGHEAGNDLLFTGSGQNNHSLVVNPSFDQAFEKAFKAAYPQTKFGQSLAAIAQSLLLKKEKEAKTSASVFSVTLPGFDTHSNQATRHKALLGELALALDAFMADAARAQDCSVVVLVQSEFGRRLKENSGNIFSDAFDAPAMVATNVGTDHGSSGLCLVLGQSVRGGIYGQYGDLTNLVDGEVVASTDFRTVYATILEGHLQASSKAILGGQFDNLGFV